MMTNRTHVTHFSRELVESGERFCADWTELGFAGAHERHHFPTVEVFRTWLLTDQGYGEAEADRLIAQLQKPVTAP
jgi:hypothetical protein